jgi:hypothetical protein
MKLEGCGIKGISLEDRVRQSLAVNFDMANITREMELKRQSHFPSTEWDLLLTKFTR